MGLKKHLLSAALIVLVFSFSFIIAGRFAGHNWISDLASVFASSKNVDGGLKRKKAAAPGISADSFLIKIKSSSKGLMRANPAASDTGIASLDALNKSNKVKEFKQVGKPGKNSKKDAAVFRWYKVALDMPEVVYEVDDGRATGDPRPLALDRIMEQYKKDPNIEKVEPNAVVSINASPNDPYYSSAGAWGQAYPDLWGLQKIKAAEAWDQATGTASVIVADIDTGVDRNHPDIAANMWVNSGETPGNGIDDDGNGYVDDYYGWDFNNNDNDPMDDHGHGTHTVGTIAAVGDNALGVVGVNWTSKIMALKFLDSQGSGYLENGIKALQYAADMGAEVSSNSWGASGSYTAMEDAIMYEHDKGMTVVVAAANADSDALDYNPANADGAITVAASDWNDQKASFSNWGEKIDVSAPGVKILSLKASQNNMCTASSGNIVGNEYCVVSGTSMATPHVAGLAALLLSKNPSLTNEEIRQILRAGADDLGTPGKDSQFGYGRINAAGSMNLSQTSPLTPWISSPRSRTLTGSTLSISGSVGGPSFSSYKLEYGKGRAPSGWTVIKTSNTQPSAGAVLGSLDSTQLADDVYILRLTATDLSGKTYQYQVNDILVDNFDNSITSPFGLVSLSSVDVYGTALTKNGLGFASYKLEWSGDGGNTWSTGGLTLFNGGSQPVSSGKLGTWNTSGLTNGTTYLLRLSVTGTNGVSATTDIPVIADKDLAAGWPKAISTSNTPRHISPVLADMNGDGKKEIMVGGGDGKLYAYKKDGSQLPGFPVSFPDSSYLRTPNAADLDDDGKPEILAQVVTASSDQKIYIVKGDGTLYPGWTAVTVGVSTPTVADLNGDGAKEIAVMVARTMYNETIFDLHAYTLKGSEITGFPKHISAPPVGFASGQIFPVSEVGSLSISDLNRDGAPEIAFIYSNRFYLFDNSGNVLPGWPVIVAPVGENFYVFEGLSFSSGDLDGDGNLELFAQNNFTCNFVGGNVGGCYGGNAESVLYALRRDGTVLPGWPKTTASDGFYAASPYPAGGWSPAVADLDGDGKDDVIIDHYKSAFTAFGYEGKKSIPAAGAGYSSPAVADVDGDNHLEAASGYYNGIVVYKDNGTALLNKAIGEYKEGWVNGSLALGDLDNNGKEEVVAISDSTSNSIASAQRIYVWELGTANLTSHEWPMFAHDEARSGNLSGNPILPPVPDTEAPTAPGGLTALASQTPSVSLSWTQSTDNIGVEEYRIYRNGAQIATSTGTVYLDKNVSYSTAYSYTVKAADKAGNLSGPSNTASATTPAAPQPAQKVSITSVSTSNLTTTSIKILWKTNIPSTGKVRYGTSSTNLNMVVEDNNPGTSHAVNITGLAKSARYYYQVVATSQDGSSSATSTTSNFRTKAK